MKYYFFLLLCPLVHSICFPEETLAECLARKKKGKHELKLNGAGEDDFLESRNSGLGKECFKLKIRIKFHLHKIRDNIQPLKL